VEIDLANRISGVLPEFYGRHPDITVDLMPATHYDIAWDPEINTADVREVFVAHFGDHIRLDLQGVIIDLNPFIDGDPTFDRSDFLASTLGTMTAGGVL